MTPFEGRDVRGLPPANGSEGLSETPLATDLRCSTSSNSTYPPDIGLTTVYASIPKRLGHALDRNRR